jgi:Na+-transporting methylmalonyl-CoA/oxaloacetate decarboxylase gamma subunit
MYTGEQLMDRLKFFIGICLSLTLFGIVFVVLYSLIFVTQRLNAISPIDQKFFELIVPIATFLTGTLSGIMLSGAKKEDQEAMLAAQQKANENFETTKKQFTATSYHHHLLVVLLLVVTHHNLQVHLVATQTNLLQHRQLCTWIWW